MKKAFFFLPLLLASVSFGTPAVTSVSGSVTYGSTLTIAGSGFGTKPIRDKQTLYANFKSNVNPSTWSYVTSWSDVANTQFKTTDCGEGGGCLGETSGWEASNKITAALVHDDVGAGGKFSISWMWKSDIGNVSDTMNWKTYRWWPFGGASKNNVYGGQQIDGGFVNYVENLVDGLSPIPSSSDSSGTDRAYTDDIEPVPSAYQQVEMLFQLNSTGNAKDGIWQVIQNGTENINVSNWRSNTTGDTAANGRYRMFYPVHMVLTGAGTPISSGHYFRIDNIVADTSWCAAWVTTNSTNGAGGTKYWLPIIDWTNGTVRVVWANDRFAAGSTVYLYIRANDGTVNSSGKAITVASAGVAAPTVTSLSVSSGPANGNTSTVITGTGIDSGCSVLIGTVSVTSVTFNSSTSLSIVTPANAAGAATVTVTNPDSQSGSLSSGFTYYAAPTITTLTVSSGPAAGNTATVINGTGFRTGNETVKFGTNTAVSVTVYTSSITCLTPASALGSKDVTVTDNFGQVATKVGGFIYFAPPTIASVTPGTGIRTGGDTITLVGTNFISTDIIKIGTTSVTSSTYINAFLFNAVTPSIPAGTYNVSVTDPFSQTATATNAFVATDPPTPAVPLYTTAFPWITGN